MQEDKDYTQLALNRGQLLTWEFVLEMINDGKAHLLKEVCERSIERLKLEADGK